MAWHGMVGFGYPKRVEHRVVAISHGTSLHSNAALQCTAHAACLWQALLPRVFWVFYVPGVYNACMIFFFVVLTFS